MTQTPLIPRQVIPDLTVPLVGGGHWSLADQTPGQFTLIVVYRGLHCPICSNYLADLNRKLDDFGHSGTVTPTLILTPKDRPPVAISSSSSTLVAMRPTGTVDISKKLALPTVKMLTFGKSWRVDAWPTRFE